VQRRRTSAPIDDLALLTNNPRASHCQEANVESRGIHKKLTTILSADVMRYSGPTSTEDAGTLRRLNEIRALVKACVQGYRGRVVDPPGDALLAEFGSVVDAVECAVVIQKELKNQNERLPENRRMHVRIGINLGEVIVEGDKLYGDGVNIAARLESLAEPGGICISGSAYDRIGNKLPFGYEPLGPQMVTDLSNPVQVYRAITTADDDGSPARRTARAAAAPMAPRDHALAPSPASRRAALVAGALVALGAIGGVAVWRLTQPSPITAAIPSAVVQKPSLAVLPIANTTGDSARDAVAAQIDVEVRDSLAAFSGLVTSALTSVLPYRGRPVSVSQAARELNVRYILDGHLTIVDGRARIVASLIDTATGTTLWTDRFDATNVAVTEPDLLLRTIGALPIALTADEQRKLRARKGPIPPAPRPPMPAPFVEPPAGTSPARTGSPRRDQKSRVAPPSPARERAAAFGPQPPAPTREIPHQSL
jgi:adenylate cyclase